MTVMKKILMLAAVILFFHGCTKQDSNVEQHKIGQNSNSTVDEMNDITAFLNGFDSTLYVIPENKNEVIKKLNAQLIEGNVYKINTLTISSNKITYIFKLKEASLNNILFYITDSDQRYFELAAEKDSARAELLNKFKSGGVFYRVYKNAQCTNINQASVSDCYAESYTEIDLKDSTVKYIKTGKFLKMEYQLINHCVKGNDYCVEALVVKTIRKKYDDPLCRNLLETTDWNYDYSCLK